MKINDISLIFNMYSVLQNENKISNQNRICVLAFSNVYFHRFEATSCVN